MLTTSNIFILITLKKVFKSTIQFFLFILSAVNTSIAQQHDKIYIYNDEGVSQESYFHTMTTIKKHLPTCFKVEPINANDIKTGTWIQQAKLLIIPGGADLPYLKKLDGLGAKYIKQFVENGGAYLGVCAGAYFGSKQVEFDKNGPLEVLGQRPLGFFDGTSVGPYSAPYSYSDNSSAKAVEIRIKKNQHKKLFVYYNGGGYFKHAYDYPNTTIFANYDNGPAAIITIFRGKGRVLLSGVHFEYDPDYLDSNNIHLTAISKILKNTDSKRIVLIHNIMNYLIPTECS